MGRSGLVACLALLLTTALSGCFGLAVTYPAVCENDTPSPEIHNLFATPPYFAGNKSDFLREWGMPDEVMTTAEGKEIWSYERNLWCGVSPAFVVIVPLLLPLCDGYDKIEFEGDRAVNLHTRHSVTAGMILSFPGPAAAGKDDNCTYPHPSKDSYDLAEAIPADKGLIFMYFPRTIPGNMYFKVYINKEYMATLHGNTSYALLTDPGQKELEFTGKYSRRLTVDILPGEKYFIKLQPAPFRRQWLAVVAEETALKELSRFSPVPAP